jgi:DNA-binding CsgD family transcriptional regulator
MTRSTDPRLAVVDRWYLAYDDRDLDTLWEISHPDVEIVPMLSKLPGATFHGHAGLRTLAEWSWENYPTLRLESYSSRKVPGWILGSAKYIVDEQGTPPVRRATETLFRIDDGYIRAVRSFVADSPAIEAATGVPVLTEREREVFELLAKGLTAPQIAELLVLSPTTVRTHVQNGVARLGASTRLEALAIAVKRGEIHL